MLALDADGICWSAGSNKHGELGRSGASSFGKVELKVKIQEISAGFRVSFFINQDSDLYSCGSATLACQMKDGNVPLLVSAKNVK